MNGFQILAVCVLAWFVGWIFEHRLGLKSLHASILTVSLFMLTAFFARSWWWSLNG